MPDRNVIMSEFEAKQKEFSCKAFECSALTGQGIQNAMYSMIYECLRPVEDFVSKFEEEMKEHMKNKRASEMGEFQLTQSVDN